MSTLPPPAKKPKPSKVSTMTASHQHWLLKIPAAVTLAYTTAPAGTAFGTLTFTKPPTGKPVFTFAVPTATPNHYTFPPPPKTTSLLHGMTCPEPNKSAVVVATVTRQPGLILADDEAGKKSVYARTQAAATTALVLPSEDVVKSEGHLRSAFGDAVAATGAALLEGEEEEGRMEEGEGEEGMDLRGKVLKVFGSEGKAFSLKEIKAKTGATEADIKTILVVYCEYNKKGDNKQKWSLKKEYAS